MSPRIVRVVTLCLICATEVQADGFGGGEQVDAWSWNWDSLVILNLCLFAWCYRVGRIRLWQHPRWQSRIGGVNVCSFYASLMVVFLVLLSPLDAISASLASAHMTQHMLLALVAAPLFARGAPEVVIGCGLPSPWRRSFHGGPVLTRALWNPVVVWSAFALTLWAWHHPILYQAALRDEIVHDAQHLTFFGAGVFFWRVVVDPVSSRRMSAPASVLFLFTTALHASALGIFMTFSPRPWYVDYAMSTIGWGLTPLEDQQLAGLIMWLPGCLIYPLAAAVTIGLWLAGRNDVESSEVSVHRRNEWEESCKATLSST